MAQAQLKADTALSDWDASAVARGKDLYDRVRAILPQIAANAGRAEEERVVPAENIALLKETGFYRSFLPKRYGGLEIRVEDYGPCLVDLGEACTATAWISSLFAQHVHAIALFSRELQDEVWGDDPDRLIGSSVAPVGKAEVVEGGVLLSGKFGFSSGCDHVEWFILGFRHPGFAPPFHVQYAVVPRSDVTIIDDWHTVGMRGTGSKSLIVDKAFVPDHRTESTLGLNTGKSKGFGSNESAIFHAAFVPHFSIGFAAVAVGTVRRLAALYAEKTKSRIKVYTGQNAASRSPAAIRMGRGVMANEAALALLEKSWRRVDAGCDARQLLTPAELSRVRTDQSYIVQLAIHGADELFGGAGGSAWYESSEMQRLWRNVHMAGSHAGIDYDTCSEIYGRHLMGLEYDPTL